MYLSSPPTFSVSPNLRSPRTVFPICSSRRHPGGRKRNHSSEQSRQGCQLTTQRLPLESKLSKSRDFLDHTLNLWSRSGALYLQLVNARYALIAMHSPFLWLQPHWEVFYPIIDPVLQLQPRYILNSGSLDSRSTMFHLAPVI